MYYEDMNKAHLATFREPLQSKHEAQMQLPSVPSVNLKTVTQSPYEKI